MRPFYTPCLRVIFAIVLSSFGFSAFATTFTVTNLLDSGAGSLRQAIIDANAAGAGPHSIVFSASGIIPIGSPLPAITNADITIDGGNNITVDAQGGNINRDIFTLNNGANNTIIKNITLEGTGTEAIQINGNLTGVTIENVIIQSKNGGECNCVNHGIYVGGTATDMTITDVTIKDLQYGTTWGVRFLKTVTNLEIDGLVVEDNGGGDSRGIQFQGVVNNADILNTIIDMDDKNSGNDGNYGIYFNTTTTDVTINNLTVSDAEVYSLYFGGVATNPTIENSTFDNMVGGTAYPMIRFNNTVNNLDIDNITVNADLNGSTNDHQYGIYFNGAVQTASIINSDFIEADIAGIWFNGTNKDNITISGNTFTRNGSGADAQGGLIFTNTRNTTSDVGPVLVQSNTFFANNGEAIGVYPGNAVSYVIPNFTITDNTIYNTKSNYGAINVQYVDKINITDNSIYNNRGRGIELTYSGNCNYQSPNVPTIVSSTPTMSGYDVVITLPSICATGCDVEVFVTKPQYYGVGGEVYVTTLMGATSGTNTYSIACMDALCTSAPYGVWTANLKVTSKNCGTSEFSNKLAVQPNGPACVSSGIKLWLRADLGLYNQDLDVPYADGQTVGFWEEFSGGGGPSSNYRHSASYIQLSGMNFNPVVQQPRLQGSSGSVDWMTTANTTTVAVMNPGNTASGTRLFSTRYSSYDYDDNREMLVFYRTGNNIHSYRGRTLLQPGATNAFNSPGVFSAVTTASNYSMKYNGTNLGSTNYSKGTLNARTWTMGLGAAPGWCCGSGANVLFPEVITYNRELNATELQKVHTYLAVKYGVTLTQDYIASNDATWWSISGNTGYNNGIAGLARDDCSIFEQKQSKSESMDDVVTIAVGDSIASNNIENETSIPANSSAFIWGNNNLTTAFDEIFVNPYADSRMKRVWRVRNTAWTDQNITVCLEKGNSNKTLIISNSDPTFATVTHFFPLNNDGCVTVNSSNFVDGAYFTFSNQVVGPNCATTGIRLWLRGDIGFTAGANPWVDFSGYDVVNTVNGSVAAGTMNYNTAADFPGNRAYDIALNINPTVNDPITVYTVYEADALSRDLWGNDNGGWDRFQRMYEIGGNGTGPDYVGGNVTGRTIINGAVLDDGPTNGSYVYIDGKQVLQFTNANSNGGLTKLYLGDINGGGHFDGRIGEFVIYQGALDATTRNKVESYLAIKYGVTLDQSAGSGGTNYVDSDGDPYWNADGSDIYEHDIAGLGRDDCTDLYQKQSKSVNDDALVSFALGDEFMTNNNLNVNTITTDQSFFVWANNNLTISFDQNLSAPNITSTVRMARIWQVQKTSWTDQVVTLCFSGDATNTNLLISADPTFATGVEELVLDESTGCVGLNTSLIADNAYLTFAKEFKGPACVNAGIKVWLRGDQDLNESGSIVTTWLDQSGNDNTPATVGTPDYDATSMNFNPGVSLEGVSTNEYFNFGNIAYGYTQGQAFIVTAQHNIDIVSGQKQGIGGLAVIIILTWYG
ncbi:MAG: right-handed parallel beta-helix repeat-containing protein [Saprospiraceae bacterium]|nr:right-handed parallel beta-helix repeat-containing protein [Saprospiraceae bacterium]